MRWLILIRREHRVVDNICSLIAGRPPITSQKMGNKESVPQNADGQEEIAASASPQSNPSKSNKSKQQRSPQYIEGVPEDRNGRSRSKSKDRRSSRDRDRGGEAREDDGRRDNGGGASPSSSQQPSKRISPASFDENEFPLSPGGTTRVTDDQVQLDLPMADLMAYLQMVANHSSNLPLTRRDDPDLGRTVSSLTAEEYAFKCAAFIPSKVRILGGQFSKYQQVWDLPTSEVRINLFCLSLFLFPVKLCNSYRQSLFIFYSYIGV